MPSSTVGPVAAVGRSFGVFKVGPGDDPIDVALPRPANAATTQTRGEVRGEPHIGLDAACRGRDLTLNAIVADPLTGELQDPTGGRQDLLAGRLQAADPKRFAEDPLRVIRVARFAATHQLDPTPELIALCRTIDLSNVAGERSGGRGQSGAATKRAAITIPAGAPCHRRMGHRVEPVQVVA